MTTFTVNGVAYNDSDYSGANLFGMGNGGFRVNWAPMMSDALTDFSGKVAACAASAASALAAPGTSATSTTSLTVGSGSQTLTIQTGKSFTIGQTAVIARTSAPNTRMVGVITAHNSGTGSLTVNVTTPYGSGTATDWTVALNAPGRPARQTSSSASSTTPAPNADTDDVFALTALAGAATFAAPTGTPTDGQPLLIRIKDNGTARALAYNSAYRASSDLALPATTIVNKTLYLGFNYNTAATKWDLVAVLNNF